MFHALEAFLAQWAEQVPLPLFLFFGSILEEVIAPIPSLLVPTTAGTLAAAAGFPWTALILLAVVGAAGKTVGLTIVYFLADLLEDIVLKFFGRFFGITHEEVERVGQRFTGGWRDFLIVFLLRATPALPSTPISFGCGIIKMKLRTYIPASFFGSVVRDFLFLLLGYTGLDAMRSISEGIDTGEKVITIFIAIVLLATVVWFYWRRRKKPDTPS